MLRGVNASGGGTPIGGGGTANTIPKWTGASTLGNSLITDDGTTLSLGSVFKIAAASGNISTSGGSVTWALATGTSALNVGAGLFNLDSTNGRAGFGTASPNAVVSVYHSSTPTLSLWNLSNYTRFSTNVNDFYFDVGLGGSAGATVFRRSSGTTESMRIDTSGNLVLNSANTNATIQATGTGQGLKLPATPGNGDAQTFDCYQENPLATTAGNGWTPTLSAAATWGGVQPTVDYARYVRVGSIVFCEVRLSGTALTATYGSTTISQPSVTMNTYAYESAVSVSTGVGSGVGVCTSTSVLLPTLGATAVMRLSWWYFTTS